MKEFYLHKLLPFWGKHTRHFQANTILYLLFSNAQQFHLLTLYNYYM